MRKPPQILDRQTVALGASGAIADCTLMELDAIAGRPTTREWLATICTATNYAEGWGKTPEAATRKALESRVEALQASLAEIRLFMQAKGWEVSP